MITTKPKFGLIASVVSLAVVLLTAGCGSKPVDAPFEEQLREQLELAENGALITIPAGTFEFDRSLSLKADGITLRGQGMDQSILSFKNQIAGAEGLTVTGDDFVIEDLAIEDTIGDALKINEGTNIVIRRVRTEWTNGPDVENGAYGIYPVQTTNVLIEGNVAIGASDAGIYVGQSRQVIVRHNRAEYNVAGIEIENTIGADVYMNVADHNTGGILVFNMPGIPQRGHSTRVFNNDVRANNTANFAAPGTAVSGVPAGSGILVNSNDRVEIFNNRLADNATGNILISSYFSANYAGQRKLAAEFDPYPEEIMIYDNEFSGGGENPGADYLVNLKNQLFGIDGTFPDVIWDGIINPEKDQTRAPICLQNGDAQLLTVDAGNEFANAGIYISAEECSISKLAPISLDGIAL